MFFLRSQEDWIRPTTEWLINNDKHSKLNSLRIICAGDSLFSEAVRVATAQEDMNVSGVFYRDQATKGTSDRCPSKNRRFLL